MLEDELLVLEPLPGFGEEELLRSHKNVRVKSIGGVELRTGLIRIYWGGMEGGTSIAAIGLTRRGKWWVAPVNWTKPAHPLRIRDEERVGYASWEDIERIEYVTDDRR